MGFLAAIIPITQLDRRSYYVILLQIIVLHNAIQRQFKYSHSNRVFTRSSKRPANFQQMHSKYT